MTCLRCEVVRAKIIAAGMVGLRKTGKQVVDELQSRYGPVYQLIGRRVVRVTPSGQIHIVEVRR